MLSDRMSDFSKKSWKSLIICCENVLTEIMILLKIKKLTCTQNLPTSVIEL